MGLTTWMFRVLGWLSRALLAPLSRTKTWLLDTKVTGNVTGEEAGAVGEAAIEINTVARVRKFAPRITTLALGTPASNRFGAKPDICGPSALKVAELETLPSALITITGISTAVCTE